MAVTDALHVSAHPHATLPRRGGQRDLDAIAALVRELDTRSGTLTAIEGAVS